MSDEKPEHRLRAPATKQDLLDLRQHMLDCLAKMDELGLTEGAPDLDLAINRFGERYLPKL